MIAGTLMKAEICWWQLETEDEEMKDVEKLKASVRGFGGKMKA